MSHLFSPKFIVEQFDRFVVGQERAKNDLAFLGFYQSMRQQLDKRNYEDFIENEWERLYPDSTGETKVEATYDDEGIITNYKVTEPKYKQIKRIKLDNPFSRYIYDTESALPGKNGLIMGPSGCGKTYLVTLLGKILSLPVVYVNAMELTQTGYVGQTIADVVDNSLRGHLASGEFNQEQLDYAIIFVDEFDKRCVFDDRSWDSQIQYSLLAGLEGKSLHDVDARRAVEVMTSRMLWILGGSFQHLRDKKHISGKSIGYTGDVEPVRDTEALYNHADLEEGGIIKEIAGRLPIVTEVWQLTKVELKEAMMKENSILDSYKKLYSFLGKSLEPTEEQIDLIVSKCIESNIGARGLNTAIHEVFREDLLQLEYRID